MVSTPREGSGQAEAIEYHHHDQSGQLSAEMQPSVAGGWRGLCYTALRSQKRFSGRGEDWQNLIGERKVAGSDIP